MLRSTEIRRWHIELTTRCNARCPMCMRNYRGHDYNSGYPDVELRLQDIKKIFQPNIIQQIQDTEPYGINLNGNLGDFAAAQDAAEIALWFANQGVRVSINTNGSLRTAKWWAQLAHARISVGFALDGMADTHYLYRQDTDWHRIISHAQALIAAGGRARWRFVRFDHNQHQETECRRQALAMGFERFENISDGRDTGPVYTRAGEFSHWLGQPQAQVIPIKHMLHSHRTWFDPVTVHTPRETERLNLRCQHLQYREVYLAADGTVYPCCYLGFYPASMNHAGNSQIKGMAKENNALEYDLDHCMSWFDQVEQSWQQASIAQGRLYACVNSCNQS